MANFSKGDWIKITPTPDKKWIRWYTNKDFYDNFLGQVGEIKEVEDDAERKGEELYLVSVYFPYDIYDKNINVGAGNHYEYFRDYHLIKSSKFEADKKTELLKAGYKLQEWEKFKKKATDDALRKVFGPQPKEQEITEKSKQQDMFEDWEEKTNPIYFHGQEDD